ncbi:hypothetical protein MPE84_05420 [Aeromonas veronii]|uniref:hypothetical protein n=1 Tax=Aeromonas veronii TaxID=654 RepID=UPI0007B5BCD0|nr:hypothetical protein [Aeromonas veronii]ANB68748.1 hypothetical protein A6033_09180 [Aeromonas veronii]MCJ8233731.1 hypothetical protein [Aeromonas veronii]
MFENIIHALSGAWHIISLVIGLMVAVVTAIVYWYEVKYWHMEMRLRMPWFGRIAAWVRNPGENEKSSEDNPNAVGFNPGEKGVCSAYDTFYKMYQPSEENFKRNLDYLGKADEADRSEKGLGIWLLMIVLMVIEASAFGYALAPFALTMATPNTAIVGAFFLGLVISIIALALSELAGRQLYRNGVVNKILSYESIRDGADMTKTLNATIDNTYDDNGAKPFQQLLNRINVPIDKYGQPQRRFSIIAGYGIFIIGLAVAAFWVRTETLNQQEALLVENPTAVIQSTDDFPVASGEDEIPLPSDMAELSASSSQKSAQDQIDAIHRASLVTFAVLSGLFVFIQFTSTFLAFRHSFAGTYSRGAWEMTHKYNSASEFVRHHKIKADAIAQDAQSSLAKLQSLQDKVFRVSGKTKDNLSHNKDSRTFLRYVEEQESIDHIKKNREIGKQGTNLIRNYVKKTLDDLDAATKAGDNQRIEEIIAIAGPRFEAINDPELNGEKERFYAVVNFFSAKAPPVQTPQPIQHFPKPVSEPVITTPVVAIEQPEKEREALAVNSKMASFNPHAWGDLTQFDEDDMEYVANKKGALVEDLKRARRLQLLDKVEA